MSADFERWHWSRPRGSEEFEPARVDYRDGKPQQVWFAGMDTAFPADDCDIGPEITKAIE